MVSFERSWASYVWTKFKHFSKNNICQSKIHLCQNASWAIKFMSEIWYWSHSKAHGRITFGTNSNIFQKIIYVRIHEVNENNFWEISKCWNLLGYRSPEILQFWWYKSHFWFPGASYDADSVYRKNNAFDREMKKLRWESEGVGFYLGQSICELFHWQLFCNHSLLLLMW